MDKTSSLTSLVHPVTAIKINDRVEQVADIFLNDEQYATLLSLPVVADNGQPMGAISRYTIMNIFLNRFGRELYGRTPVAEVMNHAPLIVDINQPLEIAAQFITDTMGFPVTEDFIITDNGEYRGMGVVLDLLRAMESKVDARNRELARAYQNLKESQAQLIQSEKMASLGQMVAGVAHEINTPLGYVKSNLEVVADTFSKVDELLKLYASVFQQLINLNDEIDQTQLEQNMVQVTKLQQELNEDGILTDMPELFSDTNYGIEQISELVGSLKDFSRTDRAKVDSTNINDCLNSALLISKNLTKHKAEIIKRLGDVPTITCSPSQINQVLLNLITNAAQAIKEKGKILVETFAQDGFVHIVIQDNGKGIAKETLPRIFDPFFTTKAVGEGSGMGLSICYKIIQQHQGHIKVQSIPGQGSRFTVKLPIKQRNELKLAV